MPGVIEHRLARVLADDHRHDVASFDLDGPRGSFSLQLATHTDYDDAVWNLCDSPPPIPNDLAYESLDQGQGSVLLRSDADSVRDAVAELNELRRAIGGDHTVIGGAKTYRAFHGTPSLRGLASGLKARLSQVVG